MAASQGKGDNWQAIAAANNIENPRFLQPGQLIDLDAKLPQPPFGTARFRIIREEKVYGGSNQ